MSRTTRQRRRRFARRSVHEPPNRPCHQRESGHRPRHRRTHGPLGWRMYGGLRNDVAAKELAAESEPITPAEPDVTCTTSST